MDYWIFLVFPPLLKYKLQLVSKVFPHMMEVLLLGNTNCDMSSSRGRERWRPVPIGRKKGTRIFSKTGSFHRKSVLQMNDAPHHEKYCLSLFRVICGLGWGCSSVFHRQRYSFTTLVFIITTLTTTSTTTVHIKSLHSGLDES